jgi:hypothetical protein
MDGRMAEEGGSTAFSAIEEAQDNALERKTLPDVY